MAYKLPTIYFSTLRNNPLGCMSISEEGIIRRDEIAFKNALCTLWEAPSHQEGLEALKNQKISFLLERRWRLNKASGMEEGDQ